jgi:membrane-associated phospholipid phosphatase
VISWIVLGTVLATVFSSVGPCFYGLLIGGNDPYAPLMTSLHAADKVIPVWALDVQEMLWSGFKESGGAPVLGISAMPSMHVATAVLLALLGWRINRPAGIALTLFALIIMIGSVHLGWHYALDGYVGAAGAYIVWRVVGWQLSRSGKASAATISLVAQQCANLQSQGHSNGH